MLTFIAAVSLALVGSFLCSIMESVLLSVGTSDVEALARDGKRSGQRFCCSPKLFRRLLESLTLKNLQAPLLTASRY